MLLAGQAYVAWRGAVEAPAFILRSLESRLAASGVSVTFGRATFDPGGRILIENAAIRLSSFAEPIATVQSLFLLLDPWALAAGRVEARTIRASGVNLTVPAMLSASGRAEEIIRNLDVGLTPGNDELTVDNLSFRLGQIAISAHGAVHVATKPGSGPAGPPSVPAEFLARNYPALSKELSGVLDRLSVLDQPVLTAVLTPSDARGAIVSATLVARGLRLQGFETGRLSASVRFPLLGSGPSMAAIDASADELRFGRGAASNVRARVRGILNIDKLSFQPTRVEADAGSAGWDAVLVEDPQIVVEPGAASVYRGSVRAWVAGQPMTVQGMIDVPKKTAALDFDASVSSALVESVAKSTDRDLGRFATLSSPVAAAGHLEVGPGWHFDHVSGRVFARGVERDGVIFDRIGGDVDFDGRRFTAHHAQASLGEDAAWGTYEQDVGTGDYRFVLEGHLRPLDISPWFTEWWPDLFRQFQFTQAPPQATVDIHGRWGPGGESSHFVSVVAGPTVIRGTAFDRVRARLFIRPDLCDGIECSVAQGSGSAEGTFALRSDPARDGWTGLDILAVGSLDPIGIARVIGPDGKDILEPFAFEQAPLLEVAAHFDGPGLPGTKHKAIHTDVRTNGPMDFYRAPFERASFSVDARDERIDVHDIDATFGGGNLSGRGSLNGSEPDRRLSVAISLDHANLGRVAEIARTVTSPAAPAGAKAPAGIGKERADVRLDLWLAIEGRMSDPLSFHGDGHAQVQGAELAALPLFGGLSRILPITALRFTNAQSAFAVDGKTVEFPAVTVTGANSAIQARGTYALDSRELDFNAKVYPFQDSKSVLQLFNVLTTPLSSVLQVRVTGTLDKANWGFAYGPLNLLRNAAAKSGGAITAPPPPAADATSSETTPH